jgi:predicted  nucleic acid-binding Zn-ribbon protein
MIMQSIDENLSNRNANLNDTVSELKDANGKEERKKLKDKKESIEEQIQKLEEKKKNIDEQCKILESKLKINKNDFLKDFVKPDIN